MSAAGPPSYASGSQNSPVYVGPLTNTGFSGGNSLSPVTICIVLVACIFNIVSILLVTRYLYLRFANEQREALSAQQREQQPQAGGGDPEAPDQAGAQSLARYTPVLVLQPDSKVACANKEPDQAKSAGASGPSTSASTAPEGGGSRGGDMSSMGPVHRMYVGQLPSGATLYPPRPPGAEAEASRSSHGGSPAEYDWVEVPLGAEGSSGRMPPHARLSVDEPGSSGPPARAPQEYAPPPQQQQPRRQLSVAYLAAGVYLWGAPRDTRYRERVHGTGL